MAGSCDRNEYWTAERVRSFDEAVRLSNFPDRVISVLEPLFRECRTVLDVGSGVGALTIPLARHADAVTALEPSAAMLDTLRANLKRHRQQNVNCIQESWGDSPLPPHDLVLVANVAPVFARIKAFVREAHAVARRAIAIIQNVGTGTEKFYQGELYPVLLGRPYPPRKDYLHTVKTLHGLGIYANVQIIDYHFDQPFTTMAEAVKFWTAQMHLTSPGQTGRLRTFLRHRLERRAHGWLAPMPRRSAVIWWMMQPQGPA